MTTYKLILVGNSNTGKTSIINRYINDKFTNKLPPTIGMELEDFTKLTIWDTAGQERFQAMTSSLYRGAHIIMFVYDVTNMDSFSGLEKWFRDYKSFGEIDAVKLLIGNKTDLNPIVPTETAKAWAASREMCYETVSAKESAGIQNAFSVAIKQLNRIPAVHKEKLKIINKPKSDRCCY